MAPRLTSVGLDSAAAVAVDIEGRVVVAGSTWLDLAGNSDGEQDAFVAWLHAADGEVLSVAQAGSAGVDWVTSMALAADGSVWVAGETPCEDSATAIPVDEEGRVYVAGFTHGAMVEGSSNIGSRDTFVLGVK